MSMINGQLQSLFLRLHPHFDLIIHKHTEQVRKLLMDLSWHSMVKVKTLSHTENEGFGYLWLSKKIQDTPTKTS